MSSLLRSVVALSTFLSAAGAIPGSSNGNGHGHATGCKVSPGEPGWPSASTWSQFNQSLGGRVIQEAPPGAVCHPGQPAYNADQCPVFVQEFVTYNFSADDPISNMWTQFNNDTCLPNPNYPCSSAGYPAYVVNATTAEHVQRALKFAEKYNIRLIVKSTGHDFQGRSAAPGSLSIWVHHMKGLKLHTDFQPKGCSYSINGPAVTAGGGTQMGELYEATAVVNQTVVGGGAATVAVGGYITGGGHSILAPHYGLAADQVLEVELVTPRGDVVTANECQNQDLFWAVRGGGGATFGVITSITLATHPSPELVSLTFSVSANNTGSEYWDVATYILTQMPYLDSQGVSGYTVFYPNLSIITGSNPDIGVVGGLYMITGTQDTNDMTKILAPIIQNISQNWPGATWTPAYTPYPSFMAWFHDNVDKGTAGADSWVASHLLDDNAFTANATVIRETYQALTALGGGTAYLVVGDGVRNAKPRGGGNAVNPGWRKSVTHSLTALPFPPLNATARAQALEAINALVEPMRQLAPDLGAYINENNPGVPNWQREFWGDNYPRLASIKKAVDPHGVLWCHPCVGNEDWKLVNNRLCPA